MHAFADVVEFAVGDVADSADVSSAEVVDDGVEAVAGISMLGGVDLVAGFGADAAVLVVAVGEGNAGDLRGGNGVRGAGDGLRGALVGADVRGDAEVEERSAEGGEGWGLKLMVATARIWAVWAALRASRRKVLTVPSLRSTFQAGGMVKETP